MMCAIRVCFVSNPAKYVPNKSVWNNEAQGAEVTGLSAQATESTCVVNHHASAALIQF
jgi:hypothetical protein